MTVVTEDSLYRTTSQYKHWSFTRETLSSLRASASKTASERVVTAITRLRQRKADSHNNTTNGAPQHDTPSGANTPNPNPNDEIDTLTPGEELLLLRHFTLNVLQLCTTGFHLPRHVTATAAVYFRRFYLANSPMTYHPKTIIPTCLFLAIKTENALGDVTNLHHFVKKMAGPGIGFRMPGGSGDGEGEKQKQKSRPIVEKDVLAAEFLVCQSLRWVFVVHHPFAGLQAMWLELLSLSRSDPPPAQNPTAPRSTLPPQIHNTQKRLLSLPPHRPGADTPKSPSDLEKRITRLYAAAREILSNSALLTDAYFLHTPSQISLASLLLCDEPLTLYYLSTKLRGVTVPGAPSTDANGTAPNADADADADADAQAKTRRILHAIRSCATLLSADRDAKAKTNQDDDQPVAASSRDELIRIDKKLYHCLNPEKRDLVGLDAKARAAPPGDENGAGPRETPKREREPGEGGEESAAKKRRVDGGGGDDVFGGPLGGR